MASSLKGSSTSLLFLTLLISLHFSTVISIDFVIGGNHGWAVPPSENSDLYNDWASQNRFKVNDNLSFKYEKDSVMVVNEEDYKKCRSAYPMFFSNNGNATVYTLDRPGLFYFISGVSGHCERGLKMIIEVLDLESPPHSANDQTASSSSSSSSSIAIAMFIFSLFVATFM